MAEDKGITKITIQGFKSLYDECSIEIAPLTILAGANSSGKSSIMQPLLLMKQTLEAPYNPGVFLLNGPHVKFTLEDQLFSYQDSGDRESLFAVTLKLPNLGLRTVYKKPKQGKIEIIESTHISNKKTLTFHRNLKKEEIVESFLAYDPERLSEREFSHYSTEKDIDRWTINNTRCFLSLTITSIENFKIPKISEEQGDFYPNYNYVRGKFYDSDTIIQSFESPILKIVHLPGLRGNPERSYPSSAIGQDFQGTFEKYTASIISHWQQTQDERLEKLRDNLQQLGLTWTVEATQINDVQVELRVGLMPNQTTNSQTINIADVGIGVSQILPVLVALLVAEPGQLVYLEQPELHLHPRAQVALGEILADAAKRGVKVVIETHSELLLVAIQALVAEEKLNPDLVKLHWFTRQEDGRTIVNSSNLDETGAYGDWPEDFGDISMTLDRRYLNAAEAKLFENS